MGPCGLSEDSSGVGGSSEDEKPLIANSETAEDSKQEEELQADQPIVGAEPLTALQYHPHLSTIDRGYEQNYRRQ